MKRLRLLLSAGGLLAALTASAETAFETAFRTSLLRSFDEATTKILRLAEAFPEETYGWKPMEGVNSVRDVLVHVTETHYALAERLGAKAPASVERKRLREQMTTKPAAIAATRRSIEFMRTVLADVPAAELVPEVSVFGSPAPRLRVALLPIDHAHEHLGQLIAYARMNRIAPPWSRP